MTEIDFDARYKVNGFGGVAFWLKGYAQQWIDPYQDIACNDDHDEKGHFETCFYWEDGYWIDNYRMVKAVMVGDDREHIVDVDDLVLISEDDYCHSCGQIGCNQDGR